MPSANLADEDFEYKRVGVVVHMGTADAGDYLSFINTNRSDKHEWLLTEKDKWLEFNDSIVREYRFANLEQDCFGGAAVQGHSAPLDEIVDYSRNA
jgi:ubiquitin C-terminal hydrolase